MSQLNEIKPPPAPPLPSLCTAFEEIKLYPETLNTREITKVDENDLDIAIERFVLNNSEYDNVFYKKNIYCMPQLQDGPKCGLVALSIATSTLETVVDVNKMLDMAVSLGFSNRGEMFSAKSLAYLAEKCCGFKTRLLEGGLNRHLHCFLKSLMKGCLILVPYDADHNHSPCCRRGFKAHWALITGFVITRRGDPNPNEENNFVVLNSSKSSTLCNCIGDSNSDNDLELFFSIFQDKVIIGKRASEGWSKYSDGRIHLIGMQGKSLHPGLWLFEKMAESNNNLVSFYRDVEGYVLPEGGVEKGLKGRAIVLEVNN